jgi:hypothetical protein
VRELKAILARAKAGPLGDAEVDKLKAAMDTLAFLTRELEAKGASIQRLRRMLFGPSTERQARRWARSSVAQRLRQRSDRRYFAECAIGCRAG